MRRPVAFFLALGLVSLCVLLSQPLEGAKPVGRGGKPTPTPGITLTVPASAQAGEAVVITVRPVNGAEVTWVAVNTNHPGEGGDVGISHTPPFDFPYTIPVDAIGTLRVVAVGEDSPKDLGYVTEAFIEVVTPATIQAISVPPLANLLGPVPRFFNYYKESETVFVEGTYSDGIVRDISSPSAGTTYTAQNPAIVQVLADGSLQAIGQGSTTVLIANGGLSASIDVRVDFVDPNRGNRTGGNGDSVDLALTYSGPIILTSQQFPLSSSGTIALPVNSSQMGLIFHNNSGLLQLGVTPGIVVGSVGGSSARECAVSFTENVMPTDIPPYAVQDGTVVFTLPAGGGKCVFNLKIAEMSSSAADKFTITNPAP